MNENMNEKECNTKCGNKNSLMIVVIILLVIIAVLAFFAWKNMWGNKDLGNEYKNNSIDKGNNSMSWVNDISDNSKNIVVTVIWDKRCGQKCNSQEIANNLKQAPFLKESKFEVKDFSDEWVSKILKDNDIKMLPAIVFNTNNMAKSKDSEEFIKILKPIKDGKFIIDPTITRADFDPYGEICDNKIDDNWNNLIDCLDPTCAKEFKCAPKVDKPVAELYIMSYCPYGLQAQKWYLEVMNKLGKVADVKVRFVQYTMHWAKETKENLVQHCIQSEQNDKYISYLKCFLDKEWKEVECRKETKIDEKKLKLCIDKTTKDFKIDENSTDFGINKDNALKAWVQWSPTFVLNWIKIEEIGRDAKSYADAICSTFKTKPKECEQKFQNISFDPMFGFTTWQWANKANPQCGN